MADDFVLLNLAKRYDPWVSFWPVSERRWWAYRPVGMETYFALAHRAFGYDARGFHLITLAVHGCNAWLLARTARALGLSDSAAQLAALAYLVPFPFANKLMRADTFHYQLAATSLLGSLVLHLRWLRERRVADRMWSVAVYALGLLSNSLVAVQVLLAFATSVLATDELRRSGRGWWDSERLRSACLEAAPFLALVLLSVGLQAFVFKPMEIHRWYGLFIDIHVHERLSQLCLMLIGLWPGAWFSWLLVLGLPLEALMRGARTAPVASDIRRALRLCQLWIAFVLCVGTVAFYLPAPRFIYPAVAPMSLALGSLWDVVRSELGNRRRQAAIWVVLCALWVPWPKLAAVAISPHGEPYRAAYELVRRARQAGNGQRVILAYGGADLVGEKGFKMYRSQSANLSHLRLAGLGGTPEIKTVNLGKETLPEPEPQDVVFGLSKDLRPVQLP